MAIADTMASNGMKELGYEYINLDGECCIRMVLIDKRAIKRVREGVLSISPFELQYILSHKLVQGDGAPGSKLK